jgi:hypothetical protein
MSNLFSKTDSGNLHRISHAVLENFHRRVRLESFKYTLAKRRDVAAISSVFISMKAPWARLAMVQVEA